MRTVPLFGVFQTVILDATGSGTAKVGPSYVRETWNPSLASVACDRQVSTGTCTCTIYAGPAALPGFQVDQTFSGDSGDSTDSVSTELRYGSYIIAVWSDGVANAQATLTVTGTRTVP